MNKILQILKYVLFITSIVLFVIFLNKYKTFDKNYSYDFMNLTFIIMTLLFVIVFTCNIVGLFKKDSFTKTINYSIITITPLLTMVIISLRSLYDKTIATNLYSKNDIYTDYSFGYNYMELYLKFVIVLFILNIVYLIYNKNTLSKIMNKKSTK